MDRATHVIQFIETFLTLTGDHSGKPFVLRDWQKDIIRKLFATDADKRRIVQKALILLPRGQGKTELLAALVIYCLLFFPPGQEIVSIACDQKQASLIFKSAKQMIEQNEELLEVIDIYDTTKRIVVETRHSFYVALSNDYGGKGKHGLKPSVVFVDELSKHRTPDLWNALATAMVKRADPLWISITTADVADVHSLGYQEFCYAKQVQNGVIENKRYLPILFYADPDVDDWEDEAVWHRVNPALGDFLNLEVMREECKIAKEIPSRKASFCCDHLNMWIAEAHKWIDLGLWDEGNQPVEIHEGTPCVAGFDYGPVHDLSALVLLFEIDGTFKAIPYFWCCEHDIEGRSRRDRVPYQQWKEQGLLTATTGSATDQEKIKLDILELHKKWPIRAMKADQQFAYSLGQELVNEGINVEWHGQHFTAMNPPCLQLEKMLLDRRLHHGGHAMLRWCAANAVVERSGTNLIRPVKAKSIERIDGLVALLMAIGATIGQEPEERSIYETDPSLILIG